MIPFLILALLVVVLVVLWDTTRELKTVKEELSVHWSLLHSIDRNVADIDRNVADLLTEAEAEIEEDI